jgi:hypothetical protein
VGGEKAGLPQMQQPGFFCFWLQKTNGSISGQSFGFSDAVARPEKKRNPVKVGDVWGVMEGLSKPKGNFFWSKHRTVLRL